MINRPIPYGFILFDKNGNGMIKRLDRNTIITVPMSKKLQQVNIAQEVMDFESAFNYAQAATREHDLELKVISRPERKPRILGILTLN